MIEIELKYRVPSIDELKSKFLAMNATLGSQVNQTDEYFNDPLRDFAKTDHALRIRQVDESFLVTFKGPNTDDVAKIRQEWELPLENQAAAETMKQVFLGIGFYSVAKVCKTREILCLNWQGTDVEICLDRVEGVGEFVELEIVSDDELAVEGCKRKLLSLAKQVELQHPIQTSYLSLLLASQE